MGDISWHVYWVIRQHYKRILRPKTLGLCLNTLQFFEKNWVELLTKSHSNILNGIFVWVKTYHKPRRSNPSSVTTYVVPPSPLGRSRKPFRQTCGLPPLLSGTAYQWQVLCLTKKKYAYFAYFFLIKVSIQSLGNRKDKCGRRSLICEANFLTKKGCRCGQSPRSWSY